MRNPFSALCLAAVSLLTVPVSLGSDAENEDPKSYPVLSGVGVALAARDDGLYVTTVLSESPAARSGMIPEGARLVSIFEDGKTTSLAGKTVGEAVSLIRGPVGTKVTLNVVPPTAKKAVSVALKRAPLELTGVPASTYRSFIGAPVPALSLIPLDSDKKTNVTSFRGKVVVLDFWASWCPTCYAPVTKLQAISKGNPHWEGKVELVTVTVDNDHSQAIAVIGDYKWNKTDNYAIEFSELKKLGVHVVPLIVIVAPDGTVAAMAGAHALNVEEEVETLLND